jgi:hypothetical protein
MADISAVTKAAQERAATKDDESLLLLTGMLDLEIKKNPAIAEDPFYDPKYDSQTMGLTDDLKKIGRKILNRWNKELHGLVCGAKPGDQKEREAILSSLNLGEAAVIGAVAGALMAMAVPPPIAAALAPIIARKFILPAKDELCEAWGEAIAGSH